MTLIREKSNRFYIAYRRNVGEEKSCPKYVIYRQEEFGGGIFGEYYTKRYLLTCFNRATKEAEQCESILTTN
jgi:hypothetical protein